MKLELAGRFLAIALKHDPSLAAKTFRIVDGLPSVEDTAELRQLELRAEMEDERHARS